MENLHVPTKHLWQRINLGNIIPRKARPLKRFGFFFFFFLRLSSKGLTAAITPKLQQFYKSRTSIGASASSQISHRNQQIKAMFPPKMYKLI